MFGRDTSMGACPSPGEGRVPRDSVETTPDVQHEADGPEERGEPRTVGRDVQKGKAHRHGRTQGGANNCKEEMAVGNPSGETTVAEGAKRAGSVPKPLGDPLAVVQPAAKKAAEGTPEGGGLRPGQAAGEALLRAVSQEAPPQTSPCLRSPPPRPIAAVGVLSPAGAEQNPTPPTHPTRRSTRPSGDRELERPRRTRIKPQKFESGVYDQEADRHAQNARWGYDRRDSGSMAFFKDRDTRHDELGVPPAPADAVLTRPSVSQSGAPQRP
jgi:hypothetical protein